MRTICALAALLLGTVLPFTGNAQAATLLTCSTGAVSDTTRVTINGKAARAEKHGWSGTGKVETSPALYRIDFTDGAWLSINRDTGAALFANIPGGTLMLRCRQGGPLL